MWFEPVKDKHGIIQQKNKVGVSIFEKFVDEVGWIDLWQARNTENRVYSCASMGKGHSPE